MSTIDDMTGLIGVTVAAGTVMKITDSMFPAQRAPAPAPARRYRKAKKSSRRRGQHPGNFSNIGL